MASRIILCAALVGFVGICCQAIKDNLAHETIHLSVVACGDRLEETLIMIKSALLFTEATLHVHIFADDDLQPLFRSQLDTWPYTKSGQLQFTLYDIQFPEGQRAEDWRALFKPCATQRLFIPDILIDVQRLIYVDTDILFLRPLEDIWEMFGKFNATQLTALSWEHEDGSAGWYNRFARHPYYPPFGVNSGVMLMIPPMMRAVDWTKKMTEYFHEYRYRTTWGDQDLINIFFHYYPEKLYIFGCDFNFRPDHCMYMPNCKPAKENGVSVVHGCRGVYHNEKQVTFKAIYNTLKGFKIGETPGPMQVKAMEDAIRKEIGSKDRCVAVTDAFVKQFATQVKLKAKRDEL